MPGTVGPNVIVIQTETAGEIHFDLDTLPGARRLEPVARTLFWRYRWGQRRCMNRRVAVEVTRFRAGNHELVSGMGCGSGRGRRGVAAGAIRATSVTGRPGVALSGDQRRGQQQDRLRVGREFRRHWPWLERARASGHTSPLPCERSSHAATGHSSRLSEVIRTARTPMRSAAAI